MGANTTSIYTHFNRANSWAYSKGFIEEYEWQLINR